MYVTAPVAVCASFLCLCLGPCLPACGDAGAVDNVVDFVDRGSSFMRRRSISNTQATDNLSIGSAQSSPVHSSHSSKHKRVVQSFLRLAKRASLRLRHRLRCTVATAWRATITYHHDAIPEAFLPNASQSEPTQANHAALRCFVFNIQYVDTHVPRGGSRRQNSPDEHAEGSRHSMYCNVILY